QAIHLTYRNQRRTAGEILRDVEAGVVIPKSGKVVDGTFSAELRGLKDAIAAYIGNDKWPSSQHLGCKFNLDQDVITDNLILRSEYDSHSKTNRWWVEKLK